MSKQFCRSLNCMFIFSNNGTCQCVRRSIVNYIADGIIEALGGTENKDTYVEKSTAISSNDEGGATEDQSDEPTKQDMESKQNKTDLSDVEIDRMDEIVDDATEPQEEIRSK